MTPKRRLLTLIFACLCFKKSLLIKNLNCMKYGWDDELKEADLREWREWRKEAEKLDKVRIPRALLQGQKPI